MKNNNSSRFLLKYGGNAMRSPELQRAVINNISQLRDRGHQVVLVHGGGPFIKNVLELARIESTFIDGHRKTTPEALKYIEMALKGEVNGNLVRLCNRAGLKAVGLSGKDGAMVTAKKRYHRRRENGRDIEHDLGQVGDVAAIDPSLVDILLKNDYLPVVTCLASDADGNDFNINADMFAGHLAGALKVDRYLVLTDVDGLLRDVNDPGSLITALNLKELERLSGSVIVGGMIPKLESCRIALEKGARMACIVNGTKPDYLLRAATSQQFIGTTINA